MRRSLLNGMHKQIFIVITQTGTMLSRILKRITGAEYNHASLSLSQDLTRMYSFGRRHPYNPFWGGFVIESPHAGTFRRFSDTTAIILAVEITEERYAALEATLETMWARREQFSYNLGGLLLAYFHILWKRSNRYYCSEFVEAMLLHAEVRGAGELRARVVQPIHFLKLPHTRLYTGRLRDYPHCTASR